MRENVGHTHASLFHSAVVGASFLPQHPLRDIRQLRCPQFASLTLHGLHVPSMAATRQPRPCGGMALHREVLITPHQWRQARRARDLARLRCSSGKGRRDGLACRGATRCCLGPLKRWHFRLGGTPDPQFQQVSQDAVLQACNMPAAAFSSRASASRRPLLLDLPPELRLRILEYTGLITPRKEVTWSTLDSTEDT
ncbi:hypothetical protein VTK56DRAFT_6118 [Thermocarpiscus australiensis]